jgi:hypothetical protein
MKSLSDLLKSHKVPGIKEAEIRRTCAAALTRVSGVAILPKHVRYEDGSLYLKVAPILKSALVIKFSEAQVLLAQEGVTVREIR